MADKLITARAIERGFLNDGDLYIEPVSAEVLLVKSTHQLSVCVCGGGKGEKKIAFISEERGRRSHRKTESESAIHSEMDPHG